LSVILIKNQDQVITSLIILLALESAIFISSFWVAGLMPLIAKFGAAALHRLCACMQPWLLRTIKFLQVLLV